MASIISPDLSVVLKIDIRCHRSGIRYHEPISRKGVGHIDIRHYHELNTLQRIALRMGMDSNFQKQLIGQQLLFLVIDYCGTRDGISWLDLSVLSINTAAIILQEKMQFQEVGMTTDMFQISYLSYD